MGSNCAITIECDDTGNISVIIKFAAIELSKATMQGLELLLEMSIVQEMYEEAALVRDEINKRKMKNKSLSETIDELRNSELGKAWDKVICICRALAKDNPCDCNCKEFHDESLPNKRDNDERSVASKA